MSEIIKASDTGAAGVPLTERELKALAGLVLAAGFETTVNLLGNGIRMLLDHPEHLETLAARPELWPNAVEEFLRLDSPVQMSARLAARTTEVAGISAWVRRWHGLKGRSDCGRSSSVTRTPASPGPQSDVIRACCGVGRVCRSHLGRRGRR